MPTDYDAVIIGAGHNGLVTANYLARAGKSVLVLEARDLVGGACVTEELIPGSKWSSCAFIAGLLRPEIITELELAKYGLELYQGDALSFSLFRDGTSFTMWKETDRTLRELEKLSKKDAQAFLDFGIRLQRFAGLVTPYLLKPPPERSEVFAAFEAAGEQTLFDEFTLLSVRDLLDRYFEDERLKSMLTFFGMVSIFGGPSTPGTAYTYGHHSWGEFNGNFGQFGMARGGMGAISEALAASARAHGATIRTSAPVDRVLVERGVATGVRLRDGSVITAKQVFSNADPKRSLLQLLEPGVLAPKLVRDVENIDTRGSMARIHLLIDELPQYLPFTDATEGPPAPRPPAARPQPGGVRGGLRGATTRHVPQHVRHRGRHSVGHRRHPGPQGSAHDDPGHSAAAVRAHRHHLGRGEGEVGRPGARGPVHLRSESA